MGEKNTKAVVEGCRPDGVRCRDSIAVGKLSRQVGHGHLLDSFATALRQPCAYRLTLNGELTAA